MLNVADQPFQIVSCEGDHGKPSELMDSRNHPSDGLKIDFWEEKRLRLKPVNRLLLNVIDVLC